MRKIKYLLGNENGASSVLVVFMMILLVTLGAFSISAANVNLKLCQKALNWNKAFYHLDGAGEEFRYEINLLLLEARNKATEDEPESGDKFREAYFNYAKQLLEEKALAIKAGSAVPAEAEIRAEYTADGMITALIAAYDVSWPDDWDYHLSVELLAPSLGGPEDPAPKASVIRWEQWQTQTDVERYPIFWDGIID